MNMKKTILTLLFVLIPFLANAQSHNQQTQQAISALKKKLKNSDQNKVRWITERDLQNATLIRYYYNNGSVPPSYQWSCYIDVTPQNVTVIIIGGNADTELYKESVKITNSQFSKFKKTIIATGIGKNNASQQFLCGAGSSQFEIKKGHNVVFSAENENIECRQGEFFKITNIFSDLLTEKMMRLVDNPDALLDN